LQIFLYYFFIFFIYSVIGWIVESTYITIKNKKIVNRGFLVGPYCPIYGFGSLAMILYLTQYKDNILTIFLLATIICCILEYVTSYIMEILFKTRWWDYSNYKFNLNGRICGQNAILFGLGGIIIIYLIHPALTKMIELVPINIFNVITILALIIYLTDTIISLKVMNHFKKTLTSIDLKKDSSQEFSKMVRESINKNHKIFQNRLIKAFPNIDFKYFINIKEEIKELIKEKFDEEKIKNNDN